MTTVLTILEIIISFVPYVLVSITAYHILKNTYGTQPQDRKSTEIEWDLEKNTCKIYKDGKH